MRLSNRPKKLAVVALTCILAWSAGCSSTPSTPSSPAKLPEPSYAMVDMQQLLDLHPSRAKLRQMEQAFAAAEAKAADKTTLLDAARAEFEAAMKIRQNQDKALLADKQKRLSDQLNEERRLFIENLETEYRPLLFNIDLKLKTVQHLPTDAQALQQEKARLEAERQQKLKNKEDELGARFQKEMDALAQDLAGQTDDYAKKWMDDRMQQLQSPVVSPEREKQRQEIVELSSRMIKEVRAAVDKIAAQEKIEIVWLKQAVRKPVKDITDSVVREITIGK